MPLDSLEIGDDLRPEDPSQALTQPARDTAAARLVSCRRWSACAPYPPSFNGIWPLESAPEQPATKFLPVMGKITILLKSLFKAACAVALFGTVTWRPSRRGNVLPDPATPGV
jgi:hypothetical protein